jgi:hypothetical protein
MENPASYLIKKSGGHERVAEWTGASVTSVYRWTYPKSKGGTGGRVPQDRIQPWIDNARAHGIDLQLSDFFADQAPVTALKKTKTSQLTSAFKGSKTSLKNSSKGLKKTNDTAADAA